MTTILQPTDELMLVELDDGTWIVAQRLSEPCEFFELQSAVLDLSIADVITKDESKKLKEAVDDEAGITEHRY